MYNRNQRPNQRQNNRPARGSNRPKPGHIDPLRYVNKSQNVDSEPVEAYVAKHAFSDFLISDQLKQNIDSKGYTIPTPIQDDTIEHILEGKDVVGLANTGTGKTAAFLIPLINKVYYNRSQKVLIVVPTRELAVQIEDEAKAFIKQMNIFTVLCIGGVNMQRQINGLRRPHDIVIATPGRLKDLERQGQLKLFQYNNIVLDEVDRMMDMGFINDVKFIVSRLPQKRQSLFFSATMPPAISDLARSFLQNPLTVSVKSQETTHLVDQDVIKLNGRERVDVLSDLLRQPGFEKVMVFGRTKWGMEKLSKLLIKRGFQVAAIHGNKNQNQRQRALDEFKSGKIQALLATDVASRGLDIENVTHVINFDEPGSYDDYVHRIGRTGRANRTGTALTFIP